MSYEQNRRKHITSNLLFKTKISSFAHFSSFREDHAKHASKRFYPFLLKNPSWIFISFKFHEKHAKVTSLEPNQSLKFYRKNVKILRKYGKRTANRSAVLFRSRIPSVASWIKLMNFFVNNPAKNIVHSLSKITIASCKFIIEINPKCMLTWKLNIQYR